MIRFILLSVIIFSAIKAICCVDDEVCDDEGPGFKCENGNFIDCLKLCDGKKDCTDGSDEFKGNDPSNSPCKDKMCPSSYAYCNYGACIHIDKMCDGNEDCADGSDEWKYFCKTHLINPKGMKACEKGNFIEANKFCDGKIDCLFDGSDERSFQCLLKLCNPKTHFRCGSGGCIVNTKLCDGKYDCHDHADEKGCENGTGGAEYITPRKEGCVINADDNYSIRNENVNSKIYTGENDWVPVDTGIIIECKNGYFFRENVTDSRILRVCTKYGWNQPFPDCIKYCDEKVLHTSKSTVVKCKIYDSTVGCYNIAPGTVAEVSCADGYKIPETISINEYKHMTCKSDASWDSYKINCQPVCGTQLSSFLPTASEAPWHVGVKTYLNQKCGGTIVSPKSVITALHCVQNENGDTLDENKVFIIISGDLKNGHTDIFTINVSGIFEEGFLDVALLKLSELLTLGMNISPICLGESKDIADSRRVFLHGWTQNKTQFNDIFHKTELEVLPNDFCSANLTDTYMCVRAAYQPRATETLCEGHSGSGIIMQKDGVNYIMGIVSYKPSHAAGCSNEPVVAIMFNKISKKLAKNIESDKENKFTPM